MQTKLIIFSDYPNILLACSSRGDRNMKYQGDPIEEITQNRAIFLKKYKLESNSTISAKLSHGNSVAVVSKNDAGKFIENIDGLITNEPNVFLTITVADCLPVSMYDPIKRAIALVHVGWRGLYTNILTKTIHRLEQDFQTDPRDLLVSIGAGICAHHYEVGMELAEKFSMYPKAIVHHENNTFLNLKLIAKSQLTRSGVLSEHIEISPDCTYENDSYFSHRKDKTEPIEANLVVFGMKK